MNNDQVNQIIQGLGVMTELWNITYNNFVSQGFPANEAIEHTKAFMSIMVNTFMDTNGGSKE